MRTVIPRALAAGVVLAGLLAITAPVAAHHSNAGFDLTRTTIVEGRVVNILWANPHVTLAVKTADGRVYEVVWLVPSRAAASGVHRTTLKVGDVLRITGSPSKNDALLIVSAVTEIRRDDGWSWARSGGYGR